MGCFVSQKMNTLLAGITLSNHRARWGAKRFYKEYIIYPVKNHINVLELEMMFREKINTRETPETNSYSIIPHPSYAQKEHHIGPKKDRKS